MDIANGGTIHGVARHPSRDPRAGVDTAPTQTVQRAGSEPTPQTFSEAQARLSASAAQESDRAALLAALRPVEVESAVLAPAMTALKKDDAPGTGSGNPLVVHAERGFREGRAAIDARRAVPVGTSLRR
ncbi:hypothetical protein [Cognatishimia sp. F0-27]|uniref:hypothetical protein n=1 Tax=Cognatishimia sp. F0-27 TaxID=2816855 RepID=UPI001D0C1643|nr:hypothetical protein [Cognatishimia sp. F0-27]MCC1493356.1 hypothetical protein [Cognatishimia sp. F0-27]